MTIQTHNRDAWNREVDKNNPYTQPYSAETIATAQRGQWALHLSGSKPVPRE